MEKPLLESAMARDLGRRRHRRSARCGRPLGLARAAGLLLKLGLVVALVVSLGPQWTILQTTAWVSMFVRFAHETSLGVAWVRTFDGKHACKLCLTVQKGRAQEQQKNSPSDLSGPKMAIPWQAQDWVLAPPFGRQCFVLLSMTSRAEPPPRPPPRNPVPA